MQFKKNHLRIKLAVCSLVIVSLSLSAQNEVEVVAYFDFARVQSESYHGNNVMTLRNELQVWMNQQRNITNPLSIERDQLREQNENLLRTQGTYDPQITNRIKDLDIQLMNDQINLTNEYNRQAEQINEVLFDFEQLRARYIRIILNEYNVKNYYYDSQSMQSIPAGAQHYDFTNILIEKMNQLWLNQSNVPW